MCRFLETILIKDNSFQNIEYHNQRVNNTCEFFFKRNFIGNISDLVSIPSQLNKKENYRCRIIYSSVIEKVEFIPYQQKSILTLQVVYNNLIDYSFKFEDRSSLESLKSNASDDILIVKNGLITDTSIANILLRKNYNWYTPKQPLLKGTERQRLLDKNFITEIDIRIEDLNQFDFFCLINALRPYSEKNIVCCKNIIL